MELGTIPDAERTEIPAVVEGKAWCPSCDRETGYSMTKVEFLGNPIKASFFCTECGGRMHTGATDHTSARRLQAEGRWLRLGAAGSFLAMLLLPLALVALLLFLLWRFL